MQPHISFCRNGSYCSEKSPDPSTIADSSLSALTDQISSIALEPSGDERDQAPISNILGDLNISSADDFDLASSDPELHFALLAKFRAVAGTADDSLVQPLPPCVHNGAEAAAAANDSPAAVAAVDEAAPDWRAALQEVAGGSTIHCFVGGYDSDSS